MLLAILIPPAIENLIDEGLRDELAIDSYDHPGYEDWLYNGDEGESPEYLIVYAWNITNLPEVLQGAKPIVNELGPYAFRQFLRKLDVYFGDMGAVNIEDPRIDKKHGTVAYFYNYRSHFFDREKSTELGLPETADPETDMVCTLNQNYAGVVAIGPRLVERQVYDAGLRYFYGEDPLPMLNIVELAFGGPVPYYINHTSEDAARNDGMRGLRTGYDNIDALREYVQWNGVREVSTWRPHLEYVAGTDGKQFNRGRKKGGTVKAWEVDILRQVYLTNVDDKEQDVRGVTTLFHRVEEKMYQNASLNPDNAVYNMENTYNGMINVTAIALGIPMYVVPGHFLWVDPVVLDTFETTTELFPTIEEHASYSCVEPYSGIAFDGAKVGQIVIKYGPTNIPEYDNLRLDTYLPIIWSREGGRANQDQADEFSDGVAAGLTAIAVLLPLFSVLSGLAFAAGFYMLFRYFKVSYKYTGDTYDTQSLVN